MNLTESINEYMLGAKILCRTDLNLDKNQINTYQVSLILYQYNFGDEIKPNNVYGAMLFKGLEDNIESKVEVQETKDIHKAFSGFMKSLQKNSLLNHQATLTYAKF